VICDVAGVERAAQGLRLALPRAPHQGRVGAVRANSVGASMEIHDFRAYQPGDDLRHIDWNAVARTGELGLRVRQAEVSPRVELILDGSASMAVTLRKAMRAREIGLLVTRVAAHQGLDPMAAVSSTTSARAQGVSCRTLLATAQFDAKDDPAGGLRRPPPLRPCGPRVVVGAFLFEADLSRLIAGLAEGAAGLALLQLLDAEDLQPSGGFGARLVDAESGAALERVLSPAVLRSYHRRLDAHQQLLRAAASRAGARLFTVPATPEIGSLVRGAMSPLFDVRTGRAAS